MFTYSDKTQAANFGLGLSSEVFTMACRAPGQACCVSPSSIESHCAFLGISTLGFPSHPHLTHIPRCISIFPLKAQESNNNLSRLGETRSGRAADRLRSARQWKSDHSRTRSRLSITAAAQLCVACFLPSVWLSRSRTHNQVAQWAGSSCCPPSLWQLGAGRVWWERHSGSEVLLHSRTHQFFWRLLCKISLIQVSQLGESETWLSSARTSVRTKWCVCMFLTFCLCQKLLSDLLSYLYRLSSQIRGSFFLF